LKNEVFLLRYFLVAFVLAPIALISLVASHTFFRCKSEKKNHFLLVLVSLLFILIGHLLELLSNSTGEAFTAIRVLYFGSGFVSPFLLFFIADYCDVKLPSLLKAFCLFVAVVYIVGAWTTDKTGLLYAIGSYEYDSVSSHLLLYEPGTLSYVFRALPIIYLIGSTVLLLRTLKHRRGRYRKTIVILLITSLAPYVVETAMYVLPFVLGIKANIYFTPHILAVMAFLLYIGVIRYDMFDAAPIAAMMAMDTISEAFILLDRDLSCLSTNKPALAIFPWLDDLDRGKSVYLSTGWPKELSVEAITGGGSSVDFVLPGDSEHFYRASINRADTVQRRHRRELWSVLIQDITESENFVKRLEEAAYTDTLTGLYNRRHFADIATPFVERAQRLSLPYYVIIADLDFFKCVNDEHGHLAGDAVLRNTARLMKNAVRSYDILARWGGEEFILLITDPDEENVVALAERIRQSLESSECEYMGKKLKITISLGIAKNSDDCDMTELVRRADDALYTSKQTGRNRVTMWGR
jgi:diguanylate cyclase (GGDEF)-like protein